MKSHTVKRTMCVFTCFNDFFCTYAVFCAVFLQILLSEGHMLDLALLCLQLSLNNRYGFALRSSGKWVIDQWEELCLTLMLRFDCRVILDAGSPTWLRCQGQGRQTKLV